MRDIDTALFRNELQYTTVSAEFLFIVTQFKQHWVGDVQSSKFLEGWRRHDDLATMLHLHTVLGWKDHRVASELLPKSAGESHTPHCIEDSRSKSIESLYTQRIV